jgi:hypothetical protein
LKKLILLVTLLVTLGASAGQITHEQLVKINKFNKGWTNIVAVQNKGVSMKIQQISEAPAATINTGAAKGTKNGSHVATSIPKSKSLPPGTKGLSS